MEAGLQMVSHQSGVEGQNPLSCPAGLASLDAAQGMVGRLGCEHTLVAHVKLFNHQYLQAFLGRAALNHLIPHSVLIVGVAPTQMQDLVLGLVEPHEVHTAPLLELVQVPLDGIPSFCGNPCWLSQITSLSSICLSIASRRISSTIFPGTEVRLTGQWFPGSCFLPILKMGTIFPFFQSPGASPDCHDRSNIMESGLATTSANSLRTLGCILAAPIDLCMYRLLRWSQTWSSLKVGGSLPLWSPSCNPSCREG